MRTLPILRTLSLTLALASATSQPSLVTSAGSITIEAGAPGATVPKNLYGIFFEEISHAGEGGLYAELGAEPWLRRCPAAADVQARKRIRNPAAHTALRHRKAERLPTPVERRERNASVVARSHEERTRIDAPRGRSAVDQRHTPFTAGRCRESWRRESRPCCGDQRGLLGHPRRRRRVV